MILKFKNKSIKVSSVKEASEVYGAARDKSGQGGSKWMPGAVYDDQGVKVAVISYNGKVWSAEDDAKPGNDLTKYANPLYNPYA